MQLQKEVLSDVSFDFLDKCDLDLEEGAVGVIEDTKTGKIYVIEVVRFATLEEAETYAEGVLADHHAMSLITDTIH